MALTKLLQYLYQGQTTLHTRQDKEDVLALSQILGMSLNLEKDVDEDDSDTMMVPSEPQKVDVSSLGRTKKQKTEKKVVDIPKESSKDKTTKNESKKKDKPTKEHVHENLAMENSISPVQKTTPIVSSPEKEYGMNAQDYDRALAFAQKDRLKVRLPNCAKDHAEEVENLTTTKTDDVETTALMKNPLFDDSYDQMDKNDPNDETISKIRKPAKENLDSSDDEDTTKSKDDHELVNKPAKRARRDTDLEAEKAKDTSRGTKNAKSKKGRKSKVANSPLTDNDMATETPKPEKRGKRRSSSGKESAADQILKKKIQETPGDNKMEISDTEDSKPKENEEEVGENSQTARCTSSARETASPEKDDMPHSQENYENLETGNETTKTPKSAKRRHESSSSGKEAASSKKKEVTFEKKDKVEAGGETDDTKPEHSGKRGRKSSSSVKETAGKQRKKEESPEKEEAEDEDEAKEETGDEEEDYEVEKIIDKRGSGRSVEYLVKWKGWDLEEDHTWEPTKNLADVKEIVKEFEASLKTKRSQKRGGKGVTKEVTKKKKEDKEHIEMEDAASSKTNGDDKDEKDINSDADDEDDSNHEEKIKGKGKKGKSGSTTSPSPSKQKHNISFSDSEDEPADSDMQEKLKNVTKTFDDLFGSDVAEESKKEKIVYNKDSDESEGEPEDMTGSKVNELLDSD